MQPETLPLPLSYAQQRLWFLYRVGATNSTYNIPLALRMRGCINPSAMHASLEDVVRRHESLRTIFPDQDGIPFQHIVLPQNVSIPLNVEELTEQDLPDRLGAAAATAFALERDIPIRAWLFKLQPEEHVLMAVLHHIAGDAWSLVPLARDLGEAYSARRNGRAPAWSELEIQYADYALWQRELLGEDSQPESLLNEQLGFWRNALGDAPEELSIPTDHVRPAAVSHRGASVPVWLDAKLHDAILRLANTTGASVFMVLQAALAALLCRLGAGNDIPVGTAVAGRGDRALEDLVGFFVNTLVLRTDVSGDPSFRTLLERVRTFDLQAYDHQDVPFERVVDALGVERSLARHPLFQVMLTLRNTPAANLKLAEVDVSVEPLQETPSKFDITLGLDERLGPKGEPLGIIGAWTYSLDLFERGTAEATAGRLVRLLSAAVKEPDEPLHRLPILEEQERFTVLTSFNATARNVAKLTFPDLFEEHVHRTPGAIAAVCGEQSLSYVELDGRANRVANYLGARGIGPESLVGIALERSFDLAAAVVGVLKAGATYLPLDPTYPQARLRHMLQDARPALVLTSESVRDALPDTTVELASLDAPAIRSALARSPADKPRPALSPEHPAYVIYTSGSTGTPKGVTVTHAGVANLVGAHFEPLALTAASRVLQFASLNFDASVWEMLMAWTAGAALVFLQQEARGGNALVQAVGSQQVTHALLPLGVLSTLDDPSQLALPNLIVGGEACPGTVVERWSAGRRMVNAYGPTEGTVCVTISAPLSGSGEPPIGTPIWNTRMYVLDSGLEPVPVGVTGELYIAGAGLARGYLKRPELTAERFVADPHAEISGARMYRTGDLARWRRDGALEYQGRVDQQVKLHGIRIELGEIEAVLSKHSAVAQSAVVARDTGSGVSQLIAYVVPNNGAVPTPSDLRRTLAESLPHYMVPATYVVLEQLPMTPNGKVDRKSLTLAASEGETYRPPSTVDEEILCSLFAEALAVDRVGVDDNFFARGGHSLTATRLVSRLRQVMRVELSLRDFFSGPTVRDIALIIQALNFTSNGLLSPPTSSADHEEEEV